jgi:uncharacterized DUF497 family protein
MDFRWPSSKIFLAARLPFSRMRATSQREKRFRAIGRTGKGRGVFIVFTLRGEGDEVLIRPVSARYMHKKEIESFEKENPSI